MSDGKPDSASEESRVPAAPRQAQLSFGSHFTPPPAAAPLAPRRRTTNAAKAHEESEQSVQGPEISPPASLPTEPPAPPPIPDEPKVYSVGELVRSARVTLESRFTDVRVEGEISGLKPSGPGHIYFTLKEAQAQVDCVMFSREAVRLKFRPRDGMQVRCRGRLTIYEGRGKFQMSIVDIEPTGAGALALAFEQLKQKLAGEGLFAQERKRPLPFLPRRVGVVTSPTGAVIRDIVHVAQRRFPASILLSPTPVQGEGAAGQIVAALERLWAVPDVDVIIVARGGGSLEDLWCFNEEVVARAIARSPVPVVSAVGHETDFTIADFVADRRAPTPSAAAEIVFPEMRALKDELGNLHRRLHRGADRELHRARLLLERLQARFADPRRLLDRQRQAVDDQEMRLGDAIRSAMLRRRRAVQELEARLLRTHPQKRIAQQRAGLVALERKLATTAHSLLMRRQNTLHGLHNKLEALSPLKVLDRGYSLVRTPDGQLVTKHSDVHVNQAVEVMLCAGAFSAQVLNVTPPPGVDEANPEGEQK